MTIIWVSLGFLAGLALVMLASTWYFNSMMQVMVGDKHQVLDEIITTGDVPLDWKDKYVRRLASLKAKGASRAHLAQVQDKAKLDYLRKLRKIEKYVRSSNLVESEEAREEVLKRLQKTKDEWEAREWIHEIGQEPGRE